MTLENKILQYIFDYPNLYYKCTNKESRVKILGQLFLTIGNGQESMNVVRYGDRIEDVNREKPIVFLAGPTVRGHQTHLGDSWRLEAIRLFETNGFDGTLILPEFHDKFESDKGRYDLPVWENDGMTIADIILFWVPRTKELIGLTTNFEFGYWLAKNRDKIVYGRPDDAYRIDYLDILWRLDAVDYLYAVDTEICRSLESSVLKSLTLIR